MSESGPGEVVVNRNIWWRLLPALQAAMENAEYMEMLRGEQASSVDKEAKAVNNMYQRERQELGELMAYVRNNGGEPF